MVRVLCSLSVPAGTTIPDAPVTVHLAILDVSLADAPSTTGGPDRRGHERSRGPDGSLRDRRRLTAGRQYAVSAHVDCSGDGSIAPGDLLTTTRVMVPVDGEAALVDVPLTEIG